MWNTRTRHRTLSKGMMQTMRVQQGVEYEKPFKEREWDLKILRGCGRRNTNVYF